MELFKNIKIIKFKDQNFSSEEDSAITEYPLNIIVNDQSIVTLTCSPENLKELALGYLYSQGMIKNLSQIKHIEEKDGKILITLKNGSHELKLPFHQVITSGCAGGIILTDLSGTGLKKIYCTAQVSPEKIFSLVKKLNDSSVLFRKTGGVHSSLLGDLAGNLIIFREDIGRHNAIDKIIGHMLFNNISPEDKILVTTGRVSSEILLKTARGQIPILVSRSAPSDMAIKLAYRLGITLIGFVRGEKMNIYTYHERVKMSINKS